MKSRSAVLCLLALAAGAPALAPRAARAQDDWGVKRNPFDRQIVARYKRILAKNPGDKDALNKLRGLYRRYRSVALLVSEYEKDLARRPRDFSTLVVLGHLALAEGQRDKALTYYQRAAQVRPTDDALQVSLGELYRTAGKLDDARAAYQQALAHAPGKKDKLADLRALAEIAVDQNDFTTAAADYKKILDLDAGDVQTRLDLADVLGKAKRYDEAVASLRATEGKLHADPARRVEVVSRIGQMLETAGKDDDAIREYKRAMSLTRKGYYLRKELTERIIEIHRRHQDLPVLVAELEKQWKPGARGHFEWDVLARLYEETGREDKALAAYRKAVAKSPWELETQRRLIALLENSGREDEAIRQYQAVIRVAPGEPRFQLELAERYWRRGQDKQALALLHHIESRFPGDGGVQAALADLYTRWGKDELAIKAYQRLTQIEPDEPSHLVNLGDQWFQRGDKKKAMAVWHRILGKKDAASYARLGQVYAEHDMLPQALEMYGRALKLRPKDPALYKGRANVFERQRRFSEAVSDWEKALSLMPDTKAARPMRREARRQVVTLLKHAGGRLLAVRMDGWARGFSLKKPDIEAGYFLAEAHLRLGQYKSAKAVLEKLLGLQPDDLDAMEQLVKVYRSERDYDKAIALLGKLVQASPGREREYYNQIAEIKTIQHKDSEAIEYARKALEKSPNDPVAHQQLAERFEDMQKYDAAIGAYEKAIQLDPRNFHAYFALARLYRNQNQLDKAASLYHEVLTRASDEEVLHKAAREAINLEELTGTLGQLERTVAPLAFSLAHKDIYRRILVEIYQRYVPTLVDQWRRGSPAERTAAQKELARLGQHGLKPLLEALADDRDATQQRIAVEVLGYLGNKGAAPPLVRLAREPTRAGQAPPVPLAARIGTLTATIDMPLRVEALVAAGRLGDPRTIPDLVALAGHPEVALREAATFALGMTGDRRALPPLLRALDDRRDSVETLACMGLARLGERKAAPAIIRVLKDTDRPEETRAACAFALGVLGGSEAVAPLSAVLPEGDGELERLAAWSLGRLGDRRALPALLGAYFDKRDEVRDAVTWALARAAAGQSGGADPVRYLDYPMKNDKLDVRTAVARLAPLRSVPAPSPALIVGHEADLVAGIRAALGRHRDAVVRVLEDLDAGDGRLALGPLTAHLDQASPHDRAQVGSALDRVGRAILPDLEKLADHRDPVVRERTLSVVGKIAAPAAGPLLERALDDPDLSVREAAMRASAHYLARRGKGAAQLAAKVAAQLASPSWQVRVAAARSLGDFGAAADREALERAARSDDKAFVRQAAVVSLGEVGGAGAVAALIEAGSPAHEKVPDVRAAAAAALARAGGGAARVRSALGSMAEGDPSDQVRAAARRALGDARPGKK